MTGSPIARFSWRNVFLGTAIAAIPVLAFAAWQYQTMAKVEPLDYGRWLTGYLKRSVRADKLDARFSDANGDLLADTPSDSAQQLDPPELVFAPIAASAKDTEEVWREFTAHLAKVTGKPVKFTAFDELQPQLESLRDGQLHVAGFSTGSVPSAVNLSGFIPLAALARADGTFTYEMELIVPASSSIKTADELRATKVMLTSPGSHSGFKAPLLLLREEFNLEVGKDFEYVISGGHAQSMKAVGGKRVTAAAVANDLLEEAIADPNSGIKASDYRSVYKSKPFPKAAFGVGNRLKPELAAKVKEGFLTFDFHGTKLEEKLRGSSAAKFAAVDYKKDWAPIRSIDEKMLKW